MKRRYYGIDLLRIVSIFCVVVLHTLKRSDLLSSDVSSQYYTAWLVETAAYFAVDCFGIISGFVNYRGVEKRLKIVNLLDLWLQVLFYGITALIFFKLFTPFDVVKSDVVMALFPLIKGEYWFFSAYAGMFLFSNVINRAVRNTDNRMLVIHIAIIALAVTTLESFTLRANENYTLFDFEKGYNSFWLLAMYYIGASIKKTELYKAFRDKKLICCMAVAILVLFSWMWFVALRQLNINYKFGQAWDWFFIGYISPSIVLVALLLVIIFANLNLRPFFQNAVRAAAPSAFSIYLINSQPLFARNVYNKENLSYLLKFNGIALVAVVAGTCLAFVISAILIDRVRIAVFGMCQVKKLEDKLQTAIDKKY